MRCSLSRQSSQCTAHLSTQRVCSNAISARHSARQQQTTSLGHRSRSNAASDKPHLGASHSPLRRSDKRPRKSNVVVCRVCLDRSHPAEEEQEEEEEMLTPRSYQQELIDRVRDTNAIITLPTGSGKTLIAAEVIRNKLPALQQAGQVAVFLAPTNPLTDQIYLVLKTLKTPDSQGREQRPMRAAAFTGDSGRESIGTWTAAKWKEKLEDVDVLVMTSELLLHCLAHASLQLSQIGILVLDEAHHCASDHPYAQLMEDFYHTSDPASRPQILGLTASPIGVEGLSLNKKKKKGKGAGSDTCNLPFSEDRLNARLLTVAPVHRPELERTTPVPRDELSVFTDQEAAWVNSSDLQAAHSTLESAKECAGHAKKCHIILTQLQHQAGLAEAGQLTGPEVHPDLACFAGKTGPSYGSMSALARQVEGVKYCLEALGPWAAAAAAHLDMLSAVPDHMEYDSSSSSSSRTSGSRVPEEGQSDDDQEYQGDDEDGGLAGMSDIDLAKMMQDDDVGPDAGVLIENLRQSLDAIHKYLEAFSTTNPALLPPNDLAAALQSARVAGGVGGSNVAVYDFNSPQLAAAAPPLPRLVGKSIVLLVMSVLTNLLVADPAVRSIIMNDPELHAAAANPNRRSAGVLQHFSSQLLQQVPFRVLQAQVWPHMPAPCLWPRSMPPLLSPKLKAVLRLLADKQQQQDWAGIVFVERKLTALVLFKLLKSLPDMRQQLRAGYLVGDTEAGGGTAELGMSHSDQRQVVRRFKSGELNVLICTNIGSEGMDFRQCQLVVAYDPPLDVTLYIQARGRARAPGSTYAWMLPQSEASDERRKMLEKHNSLIEDAAILESHAAAVSNLTRSILERSHGRPQLRHTTALPHNPTHLVTAAGGVLTMRLAQVVLAGYNAKLPGADRNYMPQALYKTRGRDQREQLPPSKVFQTTIYLPAGASRSNVVHGDEHANIKSAKNAAALKAIKQLHSEGKMTDFLHPSWGSKRRARQLEAEEIPRFHYSSKLMEPLGPRTLKPQQQPTVTLHLHSFVYTEQQQQQQQQQQQAPVLDALNLAVGAPMRCMVVPGAASSSSSGSSSLQAAAAGGQRMSFGVLTWGQLPGAVDSSAAGISSSWQSGSSRSTSGNSDIALEFPAWLSIEQQPCTVHVVYEGAVTLSHQQLLALMHYGRTLNNTINWSNKTLLGLKGGNDAEHATDLQRQFGGAFKPLDPADFGSKAGFAALVDAAAGGSNRAAAAKMLEGSELCYLFAPLQQHGQQQQGQQQQGPGVDWQAIAAMGRGLVPAAALLQQQGLSGSQAAAAAAAAVTPGSRPAAAAMAAVPAGVTAAGVTSLSHLLTDRVLLAGHSSQLYRCLAVAGSVTPATTLDFKWSAATAAADGSNSTLHPTKRNLQSASSHEEYFRLRYGVQGLRSDLPMLEVTESGRQKALQLVTNPLKPPLLQPGVKKAGAGHRPADLNTPEAAAAAVDFSTLSSSDQDIAAAAADGDTGARYDKLYLPLELCWVLPLPAAAWRELPMLPTFMFRINSLLRLRQMQQQLAQLPPAAGCSGAAVLPQPSLLLAAVTAPSAGECFDMEGLEYLGDVVLKFLATSYLLQVSPPDKNEGELSVEKATAIRNVQLASIAQQPHLSLQHHLRLLPYQPDLYTPTGHLRMGQSSSSSSSRSSSKRAGPIGLLMRPAQGSNQRPIEDEPFMTEKAGKRLADCVEALIGAVYLSAAAQEHAAAGGGGDLLGDVPVSQAGLAAAAAFCEAAGVLPQGSAVLACQPCLDSFTASTNGNGSSSSRQLPPSLQQLQQLLGHTFSHPSLLQQAVTHFSHGGRPNYQREEFFGDSALDLYVSSWLMVQLAQHLQTQGAGSTTQVYAPAELTWRRAALVNNIHLARAAADAGLQAHMAVNSRQLVGVIRRFAAAQQQQQAAGPAGGAGTGSGQGHNSSRDSSGRPAGRQAGATAGNSGGNTGVAGAVHAVGSFMGGLLGGRVVAAASTGGGPQGGFMSDCWGEEDEAIWSAEWDGRGSKAADIDGQTAAAAEGGDAAVGEQPPKLHAPKALADVVESLVGAVLVDSSSTGSTAGAGQQYNWSAGWKVVQQLLPSLRK